jgi:hypothetical protein
MVEEMNTTETGWGLAKLINEILHQKERDFRHGFISPRPMTRMTGAEDPFIGRVCGR